MRNGVLLNDATKFKDSEQKQADKNLLHSPTMKKASLSILAFLGMTLSASAQSLFVDFNDYIVNAPNSYPDDFNVASGTGFNFTLPRAGIGLNGSIGVQGSQFFSGFAGTQGNGPISLDTSSDFTLTNSVYINTKSAADSTNNRDIISLGFTNVQTQVTSTNYAGYTNDFINAGIRITSASTFGFQFTGTDLSGAFRGLGATGNLSADTWYLFTTDFTYDSANDEWDITRHLQETDSSGVIVGSGLDLSDVFTLSNPFGENPTNIYGLFAGSGGDNAGIAAYDNLTLAIPEPTTGAFLLGSLALLALRRRSSRI